MSLSLSIVIRTKNESKYLGRVLQRLKEQSYDGPVEIILVDSGSTDNTVSIARGYGCVIVEMSPAAFSFGRSLNMGIERAKGDIIINLSGHSVPVNTDYLQRMVEPLGNENVAATYGRDVPWPESCPSQARDILNHFPDAELDVNKFSNANAAIRKSLWEKAKFDENISASEDLLWAKRILNLGYGILYVPKATVFHSHSASIRYAYRRSYIESKSVNSFAERKCQFNLREMINFFTEHIMKDVAFSVKQRYSLFWLFHIPLYRFLQSKGLHKGYGEGYSVFVDVLSKEDQYSFGPKEPTGRKKILLVAHCFFPESLGGTEHYTLTLAKKLVERGWDVKILSAMRDLSQKRYKVIESSYEGIKVIKIINPSELCCRFIEYYIDHNIDNIFKKILEAERPDLVHFQHTAYLSARLPEMARQMNVPSVFTLHDYWYMCYRSQLIRPSEGICPGPSDGLYCASCYDPEQPNQGGVAKYPFLTSLLLLPIARLLKMKERLSPEIKQKLKRLLYRHPAADDSGGNKHDINYPTPELWGIWEHSFRLSFMKRQLAFPAVVISPSIHLKRRYEGEGFPKITYIPHGFELQDKVVNAPFNEKLVLAYLSNIIPFKGADVILRELKNVPKKKNLRILFFGKVLDALYQKKLESMAAEHPDVDISFEGPYRGKEQMKKILRNVHLVVFPSLWEENHPLVIKETLLYGVPVISSCLGGAPEAIKDNVNGFIFDPYREGSLAEKINCILENPHLLEKVIEGARNTKIENMEEHVEEILLSYNKAIEKEASSYE